jgi:hybrid cluster-associated redox disulfide protein
MWIPVHPIAADTPVDDVMHRHPKTIRVFLDFRMKCVGCPVACFHTVEDACREHRADRQTFLTALEAAAEFWSLDPSAIPISPCASRSVTRCRPLSTRPCCP